MKLLYFILLSNIFLLSFCQSAAPTTPTMSPSDTPTVVSPSPTPTNTPQPSATVTSTQAPIAEVTRVYFREQDEIQELQTWLANAYRQGLDTTEIQSELIKNGWQKESVSQYVLDYWVSDPNQFLVIDLDGDGKQEWVLTIFTYWDTCQFAQSNETYGYAGELWIVNDKGLVFDIHNTREYGFWSAFIPIATVDMTGDGILDVVTKSVGCSAHTSFDLYHIISGHTGEISNLANLNTDTYRNIPVLRFLNDNPSETINQDGISLSKAEEEIVDGNQDGIYELHIYGGGFGSAGAGSARIHTEIWSWDGAGISLNDFIPDPARERVDILIDANIAYGLGNLNEANKLYGEAFTNSSGRPTWGAIINNEILDNEIEQYAAFRLIYLNLLHENQELVDQWLDIFQQNHPNSPLIDVLQPIVTSGESTDIVEACITAIDQLRETMTHENFYGFLDLGYAVFLGFTTLCIH